MHRAVLAFVLAFSLVLAGCTSPDEPAPAPAPVPTTSAPAPTPPPGNETAPTFPIPYTNQGCNAVVFVHAVDFPHANARLPLGFVAADLGALLDLPVNVDRAAVGLIAYECEDDDLGIGHHSQAALSIFVDAPVINGTQTTRDEIFLDVYELHRSLSSEAQAAAYAAAHWNHSIGIDANVEFFVEESLPDLGVDPRQPNPVTATSTGTFNGEEIWTGGILGGTTYRLKDRPIRFWQDTPMGISYQEYTLSKQGRGSLSGCTYAPDSFVAAGLGKTTCDPGENLGLAFQDFDVVGSFHHLPGVHP